MATLLNHEPQTTTWNYDNSGLLSSKVYPNGDVDNYSYTAGGKLETYNKMENLYLVNGKLCQTNFDDEVTPSVTYTYNRNHQLVKVLDSAGERNFSYNLQNQLDKEEIPYYSNHEVKYEYDNQGRVVKMGLYNRSTNSWVNPVTYSYETNSSRLASLSEGSRTASYTRLNSSNRLAQLSYSTGEPSVDYTYDQKLRLVGKTNTPTRVFNDKDQVVEYASKQYTYDDYGQLVYNLLNSESETTNVWQEYTCDSSGNLTSYRNIVANNGDEAVTNLEPNFTIGAGDQPTELSFDQHGNQLELDDKTLVYDANNRLIEIYSRWFGENWNRVFLRLCRTKLQIYFKKWKDELNSELGDCMYEIQ